MWTIAKIYATGVFVLLAFCAVNEACDLLLRWLEPGDDD